MFDDEEDGDVERDVNKNDADGKDEIGVVNGKERKGEGEDGDSSRGVEEEDEEEEEVKVKEEG